MQTVFSHVVQKRFSGVNEDIATEALCFILQSSDLARNGIMHLLRGLNKDLPDLRFQTQQSIENIRPDMWGTHDEQTHVFIENKFWAGLTDNQPVAYLKKLATYKSPNVLLFVVPEAREHLLWRELGRRLADNSIILIDEDAAAGVTYSGVTNIGPTLALTSWTRLLATLELETADDPKVRSDIMQLKALCESADSQAFLPISAQQISDHRIPTLILQLNLLVQASIDLAVSLGIMTTQGLKTQANWVRTGRYAKFLDGGGVGVWFGAHLEQWQKYGTTPLWLVFTDDEWGRSGEVQKVIEPWADQRDIQTTYTNGEFAIALKITAGEDKDFVVNVLVQQLRQIAQLLAKLDPDLSETTAS